MTSSETLEKIVEQVKNSSHTPVHLETGIDVTDRMAIWDQVDETDPKYTKKVKVRGGFTAISPQYQLKRATELWGPYGRCWGLSELEYSFVADNTTLVLSANFYYPTNAPVYANFAIWVDMPFTPGQDCYKKLATSARSKALSFLGFSADVFMGEFDDEVYVAAQKIKHTDTPALLQRFQNKVDGLKSIAELKTAEAKAQQMLADNLIEIQVAHEMFQAVALKTAELGLEE